MMVDETDWHLAVFEELLDVAAASEVRKHKTVAGRESLPEHSTPLRRCLDKFTEEEPVEGVVCPRCLEDNALRRSFALWRLPPVLVVQLKRFQFDSSSRRKLVNKVDFPLTNFDLAEYVCASGQGGGETRFDLYCSVHHIGALSGGHYVTAARTGTDWTLFNDETLSDIKDARELCSPSAYLLFYVRRDVIGRDVEELFEPFRAKAPPRKEPSPEALQNGNMLTPRKEEGGRRPSTSSISKIQNKSGQMIRSVVKGALAGPGSKEEPGLCSPS